MESSVLVYDVGTSSLKAVLYDRSGKIVARKTKQYSFSSDKENRAEIDPHTWWESCIAVTEEFINDGVDLFQIEGIAVTGQMHTAVLLDKDNAVLAPSILWLDRRAGKETEELQKRFGLEPYKLNSSYTLPKLYWQSKHQPELLERTRTILWPKDYLRFKLTGEKVTDYTEGIGSALIDWETKEWVPERIEVCGLPLEVLPEIRNQEDLFPLKKDIAEQLGFSPDCKVLTGLGDIAALLGGAPHEKGRLVYSMGSSSMFFTEVDSCPDKHTGLYCLELVGYTLYGGVSSTTGASLTWAHEQLWGGAKGIEFDEMIKQALCVEMEQEPVIFFPFLAGERSPFWSDTISGSFEGLKLHHTKAHLTKAVMEGVAFSIRYVLELMNGTGVKIDNLALSGGGAKTEGWPEIIADITGKNVNIFAAGETVTTVLYAILASVLVHGSFKNILRKVFPEPKTVRPDPVRQETYEKNYRRYLRFLEAKLDSDKRLRS